MPRVAGTVAGIAAGSWIEPSGSIFGSFGSRFGTRGGNFDGIGARFGGLGRYFALEALHFVPRGHGGG